MHTHTTWDDGKNTAREMIEAALAAGMTAVGISVHSPTKPADGWSLPAEKLPDYRREMAALAREYAHWPECADPDAMTHLTDWITARFETMDRLYGAAG